MKRLIAVFLVAAAITLPAHAHFVWIVPDEQGAKVVFSEDLRPDEDVPVEKIAATKLLCRDAAGKPSAVSWKKADHFLAVALPKQDFDVMGGICQYGVLQKGEGKPFLLAYYPKWVRGDIKNAKPWNELPLEIVHQDGKRFRVLFHGKPAMGAEVVVLVSDDAKAEKLKTDAQGEVTLEFAAAGLCGVRARHIEAKAGEHEGKKYDEIRHYATLVFRHGKQQATGGKEAAQSYPSLPRPVSSLGAVTAEGWVYVYGGHSGKAHEYSTDIVLGTFCRLKLAEPKAWEELPSGPAVQGLALVEHQGKIYRIGGMQSRNKPGEKDDNHSLSSCGCYDPASKQWQPMPDLPEARSSHDAAVVGDKIVVVGGWKMNGAGQKPDWHNTALILDLKKQPLRWEVVPQPFTRRALTAASLDGKVFVIAGMADMGETALTVNIFDPAKAVWSNGPAIPGPKRNGFSPAACTMGRDLFLSTGDGKVFRLNAKGDRWEDAGSLKLPRIVHRLVPDSNRLLAIGGSSGGISVDSVEAISPQIK